MSAPNLFLIGTAKGGSSSLAAHLASHPQIGMAAKEPRIFDQPNQNACRARLAAFLDNGLTQRWVLDGSVNYTQYPSFKNVPQHIRALTEPDELRFIYMLRNPVERTISQYFWRRESFGEDRPLMEACTWESVYLMTSRYDVQLRLFLECFDIKQFRFIKHESYFRASATEFADLCRWLEIADDHVPDTQIKRGSTQKDRTRTARFPLLNRVARANPGLRRAILTRMPYKYQKKVSTALSKSVDRPEITVAERQFLLDQFADNITETERLTGLDLSDWRNIDAGHRFYKGTVPASTTPDQP